jgi:hypothetical protein
MPKTPSVRNHAPVPYSITPSPLSTPHINCSSSHLRNPNVQASSNSRSRAQEGSKEIWKSIESILLNQRTALEAQCAKLAEVSKSMEERLDRIHQSQLHNPGSGFGKELEELKCLVSQKREEGFRFGEGVDWEKIMSIGWMAVPGENRPQLIWGGAMRKGVRGGDMISGEVEGLRFEELIDMGQFDETPARPTGSDSVPRNSTLFQTQSQAQDASQRTPTSLAAESSYSGSKSGNEVLPIQHDIIDTPSVPGPSIVQPENTIAGNRSSRPRAGSEMSLSSGIESLPETETGNRRSRAGSNLTDILTGINSYLDRRDRLHISQSPVPPPLPPSPEHRLRRRTKRPIYSSKWHPMDSTRKQLRLEDEAEREAEEANEELRSVRGLSTAPVFILPKSDGVIKEGGREWWKWGENTFVGRMVS